MSEHPSLIKSSSTQSNIYKPEVISANKIGLVPISFRKSYEDNITRKEFCELIVNFIEVYSKLDISEYLKSKSVALANNIFSDTNNYNILNVNALGIVKGRGNGIFSPDDFISRQEAATMLMRLSKTMNFEPNGEYKNFSDIETIQLWAKESINYISAITDPINNKAVMGGTSSKDLIFSPFMNYTKQQSILTLVRLYNALTN